MSACTAVGVLLYQKLEDAGLIEIVDGCVGAEDREPGAGWRVLGKDSSFVTRSAWISRMKYIQYIPPGVTPLTSPFPPGRAKVIRLVS